MGSDRRATDFPHNPVVALWRKPTASVERAFPVYYFLMKTNLLFVAAVLLAAPAFAQKETVPAVVKAEFAKKYPDAQRVKWEKEETNFEAEFRLENEEMSAVFDAKGNQLETEKEIQVSQLPAAVQAYMKKEGKKIKEAAEITNASGVRYYEAEAGGKDYLFNAQGQPVSKIN